MTRDIDYQISVMQAYKEGKKIEGKMKHESDTAWGIICSPPWDWYKNDYRIKEEPKYVPYENTEELIEDFCKRSGAKRSPMGEPFIWLKEKNSTTKRLVIAHFDKHISTQFCNSFDTWSMNGLFDNFTYLDGSPIGKKIE